MPTTTTFKEHVNASLTAPVTSALQMIPPFLATVEGEFPDGRNGLVL